MWEPHIIAEKIDARLGASGQKWKFEFVAVVIPYSAFVDLSNPELGRRVCWHDDVFDAYVRRGAYCQSPWRRSIWRRTHQHFEYNL